MDEVMDDGCMMDGWMDEVPFFTTYQKCNKINTLNGSFLLPCAFSCTPGKGPTARQVRAGPPAGAQPSLPEELAALCCWVEAGCNRHLFLHNHIHLNYTKSTSTSFELPLPFFNHASLERTVLCVILA